MNIKQPNASVFGYRITYSNTEFEIIMEKIIACYYLMIDSGIILPNDENKIRNELINNYLNDNSVRNKIELKNHYFQPEVSCPEISIQTKGVKIMTKRLKTYNRYSICFKEKVVS